MSFNGKNLIFFVFVFSFFSFAHGESLSLPVHETYSPLSLSGTYGFVAQNNENQLSLENVPSNSFFEIKTSNDRLLLSVDTATTLSSFSLFADDVTSMATASAFSADIVSPSNVDFTLGVRNPEVGYSVIGGSEDHDLSVTDGKISFSETGGGTYNYIVSMKDVMPTVRTDIATDFVYKWEAGYVTFNGAIPCFGSYDEGDVSYYFRYADNKEMINYESTQKRPLLVNMKLFQEEVEDIQGELGERIYYQAVLEANETEVLGDVKSVIMGRRLGFILMTYGEDRRSIRIWERVVDRIFTSTLNLIHDD